MRGTMSGGGWPTCPAQVSTRTGCLFVAWNALPGFWRLLPGL